MAKKRQTRKANKTGIGYKLLVLGILLFLLGTITHTEIFVNSLIAQKERPHQVTTGKVPYEIVIPSEKIDAKVDQGGIVNGEWILSDTNALYLPTSGRIGEGYNTIIYAHNTARLFGGLVGIEKGDLIILRDRENREYKYKVFSREDIDPKDLRKLYSTDRNIVTLFTCDGWFDSQRLLVKARMIRG